ncbi:MAG TPA: hypothetical protein VIL25_11915 [Vicinamibacterales bacterium]
MKRIVVAGSIAQRPGQGGHTWVFLQYALGLRRLGWHVLLLDRLEPAMCHDAAGRPCAFEDSVNLAYWRDVIRRSGLADSAALIYDGGRQVAGAASFDDVVRQVRESACLLNVMGFVNHPAILEAAALRVFIDIDPGFTQMWHDLGQTRFLEGHDVHVTVGANIGRPDCAIPGCGITWIPWRQPALLDWWEAPPQREARRFTSVGAWRGPYAPVEYGGRTYGLRVHEFRRFVELPQPSGPRFEVALDIDESDAADLARLRAHGWTLADPRRVACTPWAYRRYVWESDAELMIAKGIYVHTNSGWFSDRSIGYLAAGRPVLAQSTGIETLYPTGDGLITFRTLDEARAGVEDIAARYDHHARAARELAAEYFDSDRVLGGLLQRLGVA